jgi:hypothetical protein
MLSIVMLSIIKLNVMVPFCPKVIEDEERGFLIDIRINYLENYSLKLVG